MRNVSQILERKGGRVVSMAEDQPVIEAVRLMAEHHIGAVLVMRGNELAGIASERDYARKVVLQGRSSSDTLVATIMSSPVVCVGPSESLGDCMAIMTERHIRHLPVLEGGRILGIVSIGDLVKHKISEVEAEADGLKAYIAAS